MMPSIVGQQVMSEILDSPAQLDDFAPPPNKCSGVACNEHIAC